MQFPPTIIPPVKRIIAIGDLHGDLNATISSLKKAKVIDNNLNWIGKNTVVIQMGDKLDRKNRLDEVSDEDSELKIINIFIKLHKQAKKTGGAVYSIMGNHELMNVLGDFTYTSKMGIKHFGNSKLRYEHFKPGSKLAKLLAFSHNAVIKIGDIVFVHGGIIPNIAARYKLIDMNVYLRKFLLGDYKLIDNIHFKELFLNQGSLLWTRRYSDINPDCKSLAKTLELLKAKKMVVGHTPQNEINSKCSGAIWRVDVGMSGAFSNNHNKNPVHVLEILDNGNKINIL